MMHAAVVFVYFAVLEHAKAHLPCSNLSAPRLDVFLT